MPKINGPISVTDSLTLYPASALVGFSVVRSLATFKSLNEPERLPVVPGTIAVKDEAAETGYKKSVEATLGVWDAQTSARVLSMAAWERWVAVYRDGGGRMRVCGTPAYPLTLSVTQTGVAATVRLTGVTDAPDPFLRV